MRLCVHALIIDSTSQGSPGGDEFRWLATVRPGDVLSGRLTVVETRASAKRTDLGIAVLRGELLRDGEPVATVRLRGIFGHRAQS